MDKSAAFFAKRRAKSKEDYSLQRRKNAAGRTFSLMPAHGYAISAGSRSSGSRRA
jgi:hypothetical protein